MRKSWLMVLPLIVLMAGAALPGMAADKKDDPNSIGDRRVAHRSIISEEKEIAIGKQYSEEIDKSAKIINDPVINEYVNRVAQNIARNSDLKVPLTVKVIDAPGINAFALPGGYLYVQSGLLLAADGEAQVAGVIAHEVAHVAARHWASQQTKATILQYAMIPLIFTPMTYGVYYGVMEAYMNGVPLAFLKFSRGDEAEADYLGMQYLYKAGYDPASYEEIFSKVIDEERRSPGSVPKIFMDHPPTPDRIVAIDKEMKTILPTRPQALVSTSEFNDVQARLRSMITNRRKGHDDNAPTLQKRDDSETASNKSKTQKGQGGDQTTDDKPPVLKRRD
ncbi:MAG: M48 family metallopeptidase [Deltaproteobacteria bacterium]